MGVQIGKYPAVIPESVFKFTDDSILELNGFYNSIVNHNSMDGVYYKFPWDSLVDVFDDSFIIRFGFRIEMACECNITFQTMDFFISDL